jgi:6,7-dimethyl-8-ribityllumazine synthase
LSHDTRPNQGRHEGDRQIPGSRPDVGSSTRFAIAVGRFYGELAERLVQGAQEAFAEAGQLGVEVFDVPGAFELPLAARYAAGSGRFAGVACL